RPAHPLPVHSASLLQPVPPECCACLGCAVQPGSCGLVCLTPGVAWPILEAQAGLDAHFSRWLHGAVRTGIPLRGLWRRCGSDHGLGSVSALCDRRGASGEAAPAARTPYPLPSELGSVHRRCTLSGGAL